MNKAMLISIGLGLIGLITTFESEAALLVSGDTIAVTGTTAAAQPELAGTVINDNLINGFVSPSGNQNFGVRIEVQNRVVQSDLSGNLIFAPRIIPNLNNSSGNFLVDSVIMSGFSSFMLDVNFRTDGLGDRGPNMASRSADGDILSFEFLFPLVVGNLVGTPQEQSYFFSLSSNATAYANTGRMQIFGRHLDYPGETFTLSYSGIAVPVLRQVPAPLVFVMFLTCFGFLIMRAKR